MKPFLALTWALGLTAAWHATATRPYWTCTVAQLATGGCPRTHVQVKRSVVVYAALEADGDTHYRLRDPADTVASHFVVAECIPLLPCRKLTVGSVVDSLGGITRVDPEHHWHELQPVEWVGP